MTLYSLLRQLCGLSQREAAEFHGVSIRTIEGWCAGADCRREHEPPPDRFTELRNLYARIEAVAASTAAEIRADAREIAILKLAQSDKEARSHGLPCVGAHAAMMAIVAARLNTAVSVVPHGSSPASRALVRVHESAAAKRKRKS